MEQEHQQPNLKKPKMSSTTTTLSDDENETNAQRCKRKKIAILFAYCGVGYQGMQKNPGAKTIEGELEEALYKAGAVPERDRCNPKGYDFARSARTDKGVSAVGQVVSGKFYVDPPGLVDRLNDILPPQIRIFGFARTTASFNAKKFCDRRRYVYLIPVFALDQSCHRDRESVFASLGSPVELVKCLGCSERGRKVEGVMGNYKRCLELAKTGVDSNNGLEIKSEVKEEIMVKIADETEICVQKPLKKGDFVYGEQEKQRFNRILKFYVGTHNFHNFTTRMKAEDPAANRYIISFNADTVVTIEGIEFVKCEVVGQSFMLHQIRKMIGLAVAIMRNCAPESLIETAFRKDVKITVPMAPEVGLYLDECFFTSYNQKREDTHVELSMKPYEKEAEDFKMNYIYSHIASTEHREGAVALWLHSLNYRNYPDLRYVYPGETVEATDTCKASPGEIQDDNGAGEGRLSGETFEENGAGDEKMD